MTDHHQFTRIQIERIGDRVVAIGSPNEGIVLLAGFGGSNAQNRSKGDGNESETSKEHAIPISDCHGDPIGRSLRALEPIPGQRSWPGTPEFARSRTSEAYYGRLTQSGQ